MSLFDGASAGFVAVDDNMCFSVAARVHHNGDCGCVLSIVIYNISAKASEARLSFSHTVTKAFS